MIYCARFCGKDGITGSPAGFQTLSFVRRKFLRHTIKVPETAGIFFTDSLSRPR